MEGTVNAWAKINLSLDVTGVREDGYHTLDSVMHTVSLGDRITLRTEQEPGIRLSTDREYLPVNEKNTAYRAAALFLEAVGRQDQGLRVSIEKHTPSRAGLGGGSADAAAALKGLNRFWQIGYGLETLCEIGVKLGADVPFCLHDAPRRTQGIGEILFPIESRVFPLVLIQPCEALSTKEVFTAYHSADIPSPDTQKAASALALGDLIALKAAAGNVLESASIPMRPQIAQAKAALYENGAAFAQMTGSGSVVFGAFEAESAADRAFEILKNQYPVCIRTATAL